MNETNDKILIRIITLTEIVALVEAQIATFPGEEGEFGVGPEHMKMIASLKPGIVRISTVNRENHSYFVFGGVAQIKAKEVNVLTDYAVDLKKIDKNETQKKINNLKNLISNPGADIEIDRHQQDLLVLNSLNSFLI